MKIESGEQEVPMALPVAKAPEIGDENERCREAFVPPLNFVKVDNGVVRFGTAVCTERALDGGPGGGPDLIVEDGGDATLLIHEGVKADKKFAKSGTLPDPSSTDGLFWNFPIMGRLILPLQSKKPTSMGWSSFYIGLHNEKAAIAASLVQFMEKCSSSESLKVEEYQKAMRNLNQLQFGYQDVEMFLFKPKLIVLVNLLGLHYCVNWLGVSKPKIRTLVTAIH
ncbi:hypothetical protein C1H46_006091 [Malus baccata]|uniref:Uncharacterized protein n=1 Tax=Malus baccata TaxID=106549 RepID=A0A540NB95_MALBA|nr:hypothetical protein C1H46_006091 [Malus baccata]